MRLKFFLSTYVCNENIIFYYMSQKRSYKYCYDNRRGRVNRNWYKLLVGILYVHGTRVCFLVYLIFFTLRSDRISDIVYKKKNLFRSFEQMQIKITRYTTNDNVPLQELQHLFTHRTLCNRAMPWPGSGC